MRGLCCLRPQWWAAMRAASDQDMNCPARRGAKWFARGGSSGSSPGVCTSSPSDHQMHRCDYTRANLRRWTPLSDSVGPGLYHFTRQRNGSEVVPHGAELSYVWRRLSDLRPPTGTAADLALSRAMVEYWLNFARAGDPNGDGTAAGAQPCCCFCCSLRATSFVCCCSLSRLGPSIYLSGCFSSA